MVQEKDTRWWRAWTGRTHRTCKGTAIQSKTLEISLDATMQSTHHLKSTPLIAIEFRVWSTALDWDREAAAFRKALAEIDEQGKEN